LRGTSELNSYISSDEFTVYTMKSECKDGNDEEAMYITFW